MRFYDECNLMRCEKRLTEVPNTLQVTDAGQETVSTNPIDPHVNGHRSKISKSKEATPLVRG